jgi:hypothetical protein
MMRRHLVKRPYQLKYRRAPDLAVGYFMTLTLTPHRSPSQPGLLT